MEYAAFGISVLALAIAGLSALYAHRQATAAAETARIERSRRHDERSPRLDLALRPLNPGTADRRHLLLTVQLNGPESLTAMRVEILDAPGLMFSPNQVGVEPGTPAPPRVGTLRSEPGEQLLEPGDKLTWQLEVEDQQRRRPLRARLRIRSSSADEDWVSQHEVSVPRGRTRVVSAGLT